ncbi:AhpC/TSA family protein [bacterium]|nr:AhpC/TSA family protein [bacterium]
MIGQGRIEQARDFRSRHLENLEAVLLCDPELRSYAALGWGGGWWSLFHPAVVGWALMALVEGFRQGSVQGRPFQNGGVVLTDSDGTILYRYGSRRPGDRPRGRQWELLKSELVRRLDS